MNVEFHHPEYSIDIFPMDLTIGGLCRIHSRVTLYSLQNVYTKCKLCALGCSVRDNFVIYGEMCKLKKTDHKIDINFPLVQGFQASGYRQQVRERISKKKKTSFRARPITLDIGCLADLRSKMNVMSVSFALRSTPRIMNNMGLTPLML